MEEDDEFGDLYTDVLRPFEASFKSQLGGTSGAPSQLPNRSSVDLNVNSDDEEILYGVSDSKTSFGNSNLNSSIGLKLSAPNREKTLPESGGGFDLNLDSNLGGSRISGGGSSGFGGEGLEKGKGVELPEKGPGRVDFMEEDDLNIVVEEGDNKDDDLVEKDAALIKKKENMYSSAAERSEGTANFLDQSAAGEIGTEPVIPGLSGRFDNHGGAISSNFDDELESDESDDDLQIVLNDNHRLIGMERMQGVGDDEDDEDGEPLVIVADNGDASHHPLHQQMMDEQEWGGEEGVPGADGEKKELGDAARASGGGGAAAPAAVQPKIGYSNHMYHHPYHSQFKYVRPGVAPLPGAVPPVAPGGVQGQARPPTAMGPGGGRGRGDWRPAGIKGPVPMQKGFHPGYGMPAYAAGRGFGSGLDFTLPSHKTIFEVDIDGFEEKPWKLPGIDVSDFFNFGLNEESWKDYCRQLEQLRLETTMQSKIRVYESGRAEQDYDPDLPPELAAAVGGQDISPENPNPGKMDVGATDLARSNTRARPPVLIGRPIPVEAGSGDRLPSIDTRRPRMHDTDAIIEIVPQVSPDDPDVVAEPENEPDGEDLAGVNAVDPQPDNAEKIDHFSDAYDGPKREPVARRPLIKSAESGHEGGQGEDSEGQYQNDREMDVPHEDRSFKGRESPNSPNMTNRDSNAEKQTVDERNESFNSEDVKQNPPLSPSHAVGSDEEQAIALGDDEESVMDDKGSDMEKDEMVLDAQTSEAVEDEKLTHSENKGKISSLVELSQENDDGEEALRSSENSKERSESSKDHRKFHEPFEDEVLQERHPPHAGNKRPVGEEDNVRRKGRQERDETGRHNMDVKGREESRLHRGGDPNSLHRQMKSDSADRRRDSDISEGSWRRREEDPYGKRTRVDDTRSRRDHGGEIVSKIQGGDIGSKNRVKVRESERSEKDDRHHLRNELDNSSWRGANLDQDLASRQRDRDDNLRTREEKVGNVHHRRRKEPASREPVEKEEGAHYYREGSGHRKRERDDTSDRRKRDEYAKSKDDDVHRVRQKREGSMPKERGERHRDRDEWSKPKQSHEEIHSRREREETRSTMKSIRTAEDITRMTHSRGKDDYKVSGREHHSKDVGRNGDLLKRRDRVENDKSSQHRGREDVYARGSQVSDDEKRGRSGRSGTNDERAVHASETSRLHEHRQKEGSRKGKESEGVDHNPLIHSQRNEDEHSGPISEKISTRGRTERESGKDDVHSSRQSSRRHREEHSSDEEQTGAKKGRSKLERWASHKEADFGTTSVSTSSLKKSKDVRSNNSLGASAGSKLPEEPSRKGEDKLQRPSADDKTTGVETNSATKAVDNKHLDTVAKLKKRSERFKLPMPSEKDAPSIKKIESEPLPSAQTENHQDSEIKSERPARKRRWTGN
ncbi:FIP1[V]-like protein [Andrographis paniculata]|uniref:FIP1[V]-like protein n=1 Tax=Andrographis paniculata TaxID=175694 RepID=UPI0021E93F96|nr:FIP1[V]-like protein [Andrographis paniculata]